MKLGNTISTNIKKIFFFYLILFLSYVGYAQEKSLMSNFPDIEIIQSNIPSDGYFFISSENIYNAENENYIAIVDNNGIPVYFKTLKNKPSNFTLQQNGYLSYISSDSIFIMDSSYFHIDTLSISSYDLNDEDFILTESNYAFILGIDDVVKDMSTVVDGGNPNAIINESVVLLFDENEDIIFTWNSFGHFDVLDVNDLSPFVDLTASEIDYIGLTDIEIDSDTSILLNCKYMDEITKIDTRTGNIIWRLGGKNNEFAFIDDDIQFSQQSTVRKLDNGNILVFDNGVLHETSISSFVEYEIDEINKTATFINRKSHDNGILAEDNTNVQHINNGNYLVSWGAKQPSLTEYNPNGTVALELDFSEHSYSKKINKFNWETNLFTPVVDSVNFGMWDYTVYRYLLAVKNNTDQPLSITSITNHSDAYYVEETFPIIIPANGTEIITISYFPETIPIGIVKDILTINVDTETQRVSQQVELVGYRDDFTDPTIETTPSNGETNVDVATIIHFNFSEPVRFEDGSEINYANVSGLITFKHDNESGSDVEFDAAISTNKDHITIVPKSELEFSETYYLAINSNLEDYYNNPLSTSGIIFTTESSTDIIDFKDAFKVYPNPTNGSLFICSDNEIVQSVRIIDISGRVIYMDEKIYSNNYYINIEDQNEGLYVVMIKLKSHKSFIYKILKID